MGNNSANGRDRSVGWLALALGSLSGVLFGIASYVLLERRRFFRSPRPIRMHIKETAEGKEYSILFGTADDRQAFPLQEDSAPPVFESDVPRTLKQPVRPSAVVLEPPSDLIAKPAAVQPSLPPVAVRDSGRKAVPPIVTPEPVPLEPAKSAAALGEKAAPDVQVNVPGAQADHSVKPTRLGILIAAFVYPILRFAMSIGQSADRAVDAGLTRARASVARLTAPVTRRAEAIDARLAPLSVYRFLRRYLWALIPLLVVIPLQLNNHQYYNVFLGYDADQHFRNAYIVKLTGAMPPPPLTSSTYEAHQAPLFYFLAAATMSIGDMFFGDGMARFVPFVLFVLSLLWLIMTIALVQRVMRRVHWLWRALTVTVIMLLPANVEASVMFNNDLQVIALGFWGCIMMWLMARSGRYLERGFWLRIAVINGVCIAFKNNGVALLGAYVLLACYAGYCLYREGRPGAIRKLARVSALGVPLMLIPFLFNAWHTSRYVGNPIGAITEQRSLIGAVDIRFFTTFDDTIFADPFAYGPGEGSFWTLQYVTLYSDYYQAWRSVAYRDWPTDRLMYTDTAMPVPIEHHDFAKVLQVLAIPVTLVMVFAFFYALYRVIRYPRRALRDGSIVVVLVTLMTEAAQFVRFATYADIRSVIIHARYLGFLYPFLFVVGVLMLWNLWLRRRTAFSALMTAVLSLDMVAYAYFAMKLLWLPPTF